LVSRAAEHLALIIRKRLVQALIVEGRRPDAAVRLGNELGQLVEEDIVRELGGVRLVIPTLKLLERRDKRRQIKKLFHGDNCNQLALEFNVSCATVYRIAATREEQLPLFD